MTKIKVTMVGYDGDTDKGKTPIGMGLTAFDLPDDTTINVWKNEVTILGKDANTSFSET